MKFIDRTELIVKGGTGGDGITSFRAARNQPKLGPDGGNGGTGGDVFLLGDSGQNTLSKIRYKQSYKAECGGRGGPNCRTGKSGDPLYIPVPVGTIVRDKDTGELLGEVLSNSEKLLVAKGGNRGYGNQHFVLPTRQAPVQTTQGKKGETRVLTLDLKLVADIGLVGIPNAGKSTLLSMMSSARPKIGDYPFTTLTPNLGIVDPLDDDFTSRPVVVADIPGLISGAHLGKGLGIQFLQHIERTQALAYVIDGFCEELPYDKAFLQLRQELSLFSRPLLEKKQFVIVNKIDICGDPVRQAKIRRYFEETHQLKTFFVSAATGAGIPQLKIELTQKCLI